MIPSNSSLCHVLCHTSLWAETSVFLFLRTCPCRTFLCPLVFLRLGKTFSANRAISGMVPFAAADMAA